jgi:hypothetical protein
MAKLKATFGAMVMAGSLLAAPMWAGAQTQPGAQPQVPQPASGGVDWKGVGLGAATAVANIGYIPAKTLYAILGGIGGGAGYALTGGNTQTANTIWRSALGGDYVLTPDMLRGAAPIHFSGPTTTPPLPGNEPAAPPPVSSAPATSGTMASGPAVSNVAPGENLSAASGGTSASAPATHFTTSVVSEPGDPGTGPMH